MTQNQALGIGGIVFGMAHLVFLRQLADFHRPWDWYRALGGDEKASTGYRRFTAFLIGASSLVAGVAALLGAWD